MESKKMYTDRSIAGDGVHEVRGTSVLHRPERSGERTLGSIDAPLLNAKRPSTPAWSFALKRAGDGNRTHVSSLEG